MRFTKNALTTTIASASVAAVLGLTGVSVAGAASTTTTPKPTTSSSAAAAKHRPAVKALRREIRRHAGLLVAKTIGITPAELRTELKGGKTIAQIATAHGVAPQTVVDALVKAANAKIDAAVKAHKITAARGAKLKVRVDAAIPKIVNNWHPKAKAATNS